MGRQREHHVNMEGLEQCIYITSQGMVQTLPTNHQELGRRQEGVPYKFQREHNPADT